MLLASHCFECHFMTANAAFLFWFLVWATRKMYDQTGDSLYWKQSCIFHDNFPGKYARTETMVIVFRCLAFKCPVTDKVCKNCLRWRMKCVFSIIFVFKLSIWIFVLSSLYSKWRFSPVAPYHWKLFFKIYSWLQNVKKKG